MEANQPVKLIMTWDITPEHEQEYFDFVVREYIPGIQRLGCDLTDAWATVYGARPQIMIGAVVANVKKARQLLLSEEWIKVTNRLLDFIQNYSLKVVKAKSGFQL
jgi:hypothetical protein